MRMALIRPELRLEETARPIGGHFQRVLLYLFVETGAEGTLGQISSGTTVSARPLGTAGLVGTGGKVLSRRPEVFCPVDLQRLLAEG